MPLKVLPKLKCQSITGHKAGAHPGWDASLPKGTLPACTETAGGTKITWHREDAQTPQTHRAEAGSVSWKWASNTARHRAAHNIQK